MLYKGCGLNIVTPFTDTNEIDFEALNSLLENQIHDNISAVILGRTTGEFQTMNDSEILSVVEFVVKKIDGKIPVIAQTGFNDNRRSVELSIKAKISGVDGLILSSPYYNIGNEKGLLNHFKSIAMSCGLPCIIDNNPAISGINISPEMAKDISEINNIVGIVESSDNIVQFAELMSVLPDHFHVICANDSILLPAMSLGVKSFISVFANICPLEVCSIFDSFMENNVAESRRLQLEFLPLINALKLEADPIPVKTALNMLGYNAGELRLPLGSMHPDKAAKLATLIMDMNIEKNNR